MTIESSSDTINPLAIVDGSDYESITEWIHKNPEWETLLYTHGYILFRNFRITDAASFDSTLNSLMTPSAEFSEETSPRSSVSARTFTSTDYPQRYPIQFHHEFSYRRSHPDRLAFCCLIPAKSGGATPLADSRKVLQRIPAEIVSRFEELGISYVRNFSGLGIPWHVAFGTSNKDEISAYCHANNVEHSWAGEDLHTRQTTPATAIHPVTGERTWFNSVINLNVLGVEPESVREAMQSLPADSLPTNTTYGSGDPIEPEVIEQIRQVYTEEAIRFTWQRGDLLLIDNILTAHARDPFEGERKVIAGMGDAISD